MTTPIVSEELDKNNLNWVNTYLARLDDLLNQEKTQPNPDEGYCDYLLKEAETYRTLVNQFSSN